MTELASSATPGGPVAPTGDETAAPGVSFTLDGRPAVAEPGEMLISAAERAGTYIPRFCYHPRMKPVGVCRMCLVEVSGPRGATLQPSCFIPVTEGMEVDTTSAKVKKAQDGVLEFLLVNHPLDCPVCDKGGECPLQDQTLAYGPGESRFVEEKRHFEKPIPISELVLLDRERCIQCARCTRFAEEVAGEAQIDFAGRGEQVEVATFPTEPFSSYFSGNTVQICPVGALTATPYRFTARPWDLDQVESTCTSCSLGCRVAVQSSANRLTRLLGIDSEPVNHGWLCDKGRFVFESVNGDEEPAGPAADTDGLAAADVDVVPATAAQIGSVGVAHGQFSGEAKESGHFAGRRILEPLVKKNGELVPASWDEALAAAAAGLRTALDAGGPRRGGRPRWRPAHQRRCLRLGQAGQGHPRHRLGRRPAGRRPRRRAGALAAPGHHRPGLCRRHGHPAHRRRPRGAAGPVPAAPPGGPRGHHVAARADPHADVAHPLRRPLPGLAARGRPDPGPGDHR